MTELIQSAGYVIPVFYVLLWAWYGWQFWKNRTIGRRIELWVIPFLLVAHAFELVGRHLMLGVAPFSTMHDAFSFVAFAVLFLYWVTELNRSHQGTAIFITALAALSSLWAARFPSWQPETNPLLKDPLFAVHAALSVLGYTAFSLSAIYALMYIIQDRNLRHHKLGKLFSHLPAVDFLERMSRRAVYYGVFFLGGGIALGHWQSMVHFGTWWPSDPKVLLIDFVWLFYCLGVILTLVLGLRGRRMAWLSLTGFTFLIPGGMLVLHVLDSFHKFY